MNKKKLSTQEQIEHMSAKGITFNLASKNDALNFLEESNYYFRIKSYAKNYQKYNKTDKKGKYINLDFAYLKELSILDMHLKRVLLKMTLDIEHYLKVEFLKSVENLDDGYATLQEFFSKKEGEHIKKSIDDLYKRHKDAKRLTSYTANLVVKYHPNYALWNIIEIISFGDFIKLYKYYNKKFNIPSKYYELLWSIKIIRNACAHNTCLLNNLSSKMPTQTSNKVRNFLMLHEDTLQYYQRYKQCYVIMDIISVCYLHNMILKDKAKESNNEIINILSRALNSRFFDKNITIKENFRLLESVIKNLKRI